MKPTIQYYFVDSNLHVLHEHPYLPPSSCVITEKSGQSVVSDCFLKPAVLRCCLSRVNTGFFIPFGDHMTKDLV